MHARNARLVNRSTSRSPDVHPVAVRLSTMIPLLRAASNSSDREFDGGRAERIRLVVDAGFEEPGQFVEVRSRFDKSHDGDQCFRIHQFIERDVVQVQLT